MIKALSDLNATMEDWKTHFLTLTPSQRAELATFLIASLDSEESDGSEEEVAKAWEEENNRRIEEIMSGAAVGIPMEDVLADLRKRYP